MNTSRIDSTPRRSTDERHDQTHRAELAGVVVREDDVEPVKGIRTIATLFRGMAILLLVMMVVQIVLAATATVPLAVGVVLADAVRLIIFAGLLWGAGDLAVLAVKSHYDLRATRILTARVAHLVREIGASTGTLPSSRADSNPARET